LHQDRSLVDDCDIPKPGATHALINPVGSGPAGRPSPGLNMTLKHIRKPVLKAGALLRGAIRRSPRQRG